MTDDRDWTPTAIPRDRLPRNLRRRADAERAARPPRRPCAYCPKRATNTDGCCGECTTVEVARPTYPRTDGGPSLREFLASRGEL